LIKPLEDKVVLELPKAEEKTTQFGLIIAGTPDEKPQEAIVVAVGPGAKFADGSTMEMQLEVGDRVIFSKYQGTEVNHDGKEYLIIAYRDIFAVIND
jgi:chaperonin GroES